MIVDHMKAAQEAAEARLAMAFDWMYHVEESEDPHPGDTVIAAAFCGCETCVVREVVIAAWPYLYAAAHDPDVPDPR